ncbi:GE20757 [Ectocarpus siliculosus]|uniref:GE20757 n=1 Tax=Ectocarpus siliculosus TaxID=2880 RepID=D7FMM2_ECTSI|nr:GE20757 [Ectocarpus siliculosus]|eukprot:CBJ25919.1 GE20757 [Ectocarpus siliculosus]
MAAGRVLGFGHALGGAAAAFRPFSTRTGLKMAGGGSGLLFSAGVIGGANLIGFGVTATTKTHKVTDLTGAGAFVLSAAACAWKSGSFRSGAIRPLLLNVAVGVWGVRLASYLFARIIKTGEDQRLARFFPGKDEGWLDSARSLFPVNLAGFWTIQAMWAWVVSLPVTLANFSPARAVPMGVGGWACLGLAATGLAVETVADYQKFQFKNDPDNKGKFMTSGLWSLSRHPNYLGEMGVWWAILGVALPALRGPGRVALGFASPAFITALIMYVSGVPMLEQQHDEKYGGDPRYREWKENTPMILPDMSKVWRSVFF